MSYSYRQKDRKGYIVNSIESRGLRNNMTPSVLA